MIPILWEGCQVIAIIVVTLAITAGVIIAADRWDEKHEG